MLLFQLSALTKPTRPPVITTSTTIRPSTSGLSIHVIDILTYGSLLANVISLFLKIMRD